MVCFGSMGTPSKIVSTSKSLPATIAPSQIFMISSKLSTAWGFWVVAITGTSARFS